MKKLSKKERKQLIKEILIEIADNLYSYQDFILECVREIVEKWNDEDLLRWKEGYEIC